MLYHALAFVEVNTNLWWLCKSSGRSMATGHQAVPMLPAAALRPAWPDQWIVGWALKPRYIYIYNIYIYTHNTHMYIYIYPPTRPLPRQGRRLGPPEVWNLALGSQAKAHAIKATPLSATCPRHRHAPAELLHLHAPGRSRLPFARPQTLQTLPQASKATTLTATTCPCHLFFRGFKTAVCPPSNPPSASNALAGLQGNNSYSYMPLPSVFQGVQDCRLPALKPPKRFQRSRRPPRQQLLQPHVLKPSKRFQPSRRPPRPCHLFFRGFKTAVCPPSNPPNASNAPAGLQGNNSYSYMSSNPPNASNPLAGLQGNNSYSYMPLPSVFHGVQDCRLPGLKPPKRFQRSRRPPRQQLLQLHVRRSRRPPRQQLLQLHAPAICVSGGSRLPFAWPQTPQTLPTLPQASKATTLTATCPCHLFFRGFKTAVCPPSNPPNASNAPAGLQGNNSYSYMSLPSVFQGVQDCRRKHSYMPLPSVFQGVQDCRLPGLKPPKRFQRSRRPPRQQLLQLHAPAICFSGGSRLPFARPQTPQTLPTLPQASKATTLTATCPCHLFFRGFKTAVASKGTRNVCPASNPPNASARLQGNNSYSYYMPLPSVFQGVQGLQGNNSYSYMSSNPPNASNPLAGLQGNNSYSYMPLPSVFHGVQDCRLPALKPPKRFQRSRRPPRQQLLQLHVQRSRRPPRQQLLQLHAPAICVSGGSRLPFAWPQTPQTLPTLPQASKATTLTATCPCHLFFRGFKTAVCPPSNPPNASNAPAGLQGNNSYSYMSLPSVFQGVQDCRRKHSYMTLPSVFQGVQDCRLPGLKPSKRFQPSRRPPRQQLLQLHAPAICFSGGSRLPFARPQTPQTLPTLPQASKATTLTATCPCHLFFRGFKTAVASKGTRNVCPASNPPNASARLQGNNSYSYYMPLPSVFQGVQDCRLPALKPPKRFQRSRRPPRQQLLQLHAPAICFSRGSRLPFARPQTSQTLPTLPQASKATTLTATCPCHLFFRGFKTAVCPPSNPPNASNAPAGLQGNNSYSYMSLPSVFQGVQDCRRKQRHTQRLPGLKPSKRFCTPPRQQLLQLLHAPAICFSGGSRLPFARPQPPQTLPTLPQASKATTLTATCPCHLFFTGFKTAVCPASNVPNASNAPAGLQGNNSYSYMPLPSVFQGVQDYRLPALKPPKRFQRSRRPPRQQLLQLHVPAICFSGGSRLPSQAKAHAIKATPLSATCPAIYMLLPNSYTYMPLPPVFQDVQDYRLPGLKPSKRFRRPPRQQLLQLLHAPAICFSGGSRLPFARLQTPQTLPTLPQASKATTLTATCPCHLFFRGFKTAVCPPSNPPNASNAPAGLQGNNSCSYMSLPSVFQGVQDCRLLGLKPPKRFQPSRRPPWQQLLQLHPPAICFSGGSRLPFARPQTPQTLPTLPQASKATTLTATCPCHLFFRGFKTAVASKGTRNVCPASNPPNASARLQGNNSYSYYMPLPSVFQGVQDCRLPALKPPKRFQRSRRPPRQQLLQLHAPAICFSRGSRLPFARPQTSQTLPTLPQASKATTLTATCPCHLFFRGFKTAVCPPSNPPNASNAPAGLQGNNSYSYMSLPSVFQGVQDCRRKQRHTQRLPGLKPSKRFCTPPRQQLLQLLHAPAICFSGGSRLPFARPQPPQTLPTLPQASKATTLTATCPCHLFFTGFKTAVCPASNVPNASNAPAGLQGNNSYSYMPLPSVFQGVQDCRLPALKPPKRFQRSRRPPRQQLLQLHVPAICFSGGSRLPSQAKAHAIKATPLSATCPAIYMLLPNSYTYMPLPPVFQDVQDYRLPGLKPSKRFRRPPRQQLLQLLHAPAICFSGGSRLPFARLQTPQTLPTLPQASKATTLTATCPCHLFFRGFKTAVCPPSNPPNASNAPAGLQGNNSCSYMSLPSVFQGVQDCRLLGLKPPKRFQPSRRPPRQQLLQLHPPAICFSGGSRLPFARPQTPQTLRTLPALSRSALCPKEGGVGGTRALARFYIYTHVIHDVNK